jgi:hypothetical protein
MTRYSQAIPVPAPAAWQLAVAAAFAWLGMFIHNQADLPGLTVTSAENLAPAVVWLLLVLLCWLRPRERWPLILLGGWGLLNLGGAIITVLPISLLPFEPDQSVRHYAFHVLYAGFQLPLLVLARRGLDIA